MHTLPLNAYTFPPFPPFPPLKKVEANLLRAFLKSYIFAVAFYKQAEKATPLRIFDLLL